MSQTIVKKNHMDIPWHDFTDAEKDEPVSKASLNVGMYGTDLHSRYRAYVHKLHLF